MVSIFGGITMHMADVLISPAVGGIAWAAGVGAVAYSAAKIKNELGEKKIPLMAVAGAFVFAAQMINFTIPATGSSGHIGGGILLAGLLGPYPALLTIAAVLTIQCLFFADGGLLALGCNILNMGVIPALLVYPLIFKPILKRGLSLKRLSLASFISVVVGLELGALGVVLETLASGISALPFGTFVLLMLPIHLAIGIGEGIVTAGVLGFVYTQRPEIIESSGEGTALAPGVSLRKVLGVLALITVLVGGGLSMFASAYPDGLEWAMEKTITRSGSQPEAEGPLFRRAAAIQEAAAIMPDYDYRNAGEEGSATGTTVAGIAGSLFTCILAGAAGFIIYRVKRIQRHRAA
ncbi:MAG: energy-coupling factor ABC transporter permease [Spirochaetaceae bacterium]|jgi:cobalt/nickel transport system permease protein|nr:energy-coupling factor ABC transporter permease [Spirochaetaceae bacterium]